MGIDYGRDPDRDDAAPTLAELVAIWTLRLILLTLLVVGTLVWAAIIGMAGTWQAVARILGLGRPGGSYPARGPRDDLAGRPNDPHDPTLRRRSKGHLEAPEGYPLHLKPRR
jgi:hypothetical protein